MSVNAKHIATFILGAAAGLAAAKYMSMSDEEKEKLTSDVKDKANRFKDEARARFNRAKDNFEALKTKGADALKEYWADAEKMIREFFGKKTAT